MKLDLFVYTRMLKLLLMSVHSKIPKAVPILPLAEAQGEARYIPVSIDKLSGWRNLAKLRSITHTTTRRVELN